MKIKISGFVEGRKIYEGSNNVLELVTKGNCGDTEYQEVQKELEKLGRQIRQDKLDIKWAKSILCY